MRKTILIVDDDVYIGDMLQETLSQEGYRILRAYSGSEALLRLSADRPDLILLDLMLPGLNGEDILPAIKDIPVIVVSAKADVDDKVSLLLGGAADYVTKPFDMKELLARIEVQLRKSCTGGIDGMDARNHILQFDDITLDTDTRSVCVGEKAVKLTRTNMRF